MSIQREPYLNPGAAGMMRVVAGKIPGNPSGIHLREYAEFMKQLFSRVSMRTIVMGDFNFMENEVLDALQQVGLVQWDGVLPPSLCRYPTNIQPEVKGLPAGFGGGPLAPKRIDHVLQLGGGYTGMVHHCGVLLPDQVLTGLQRVVDSILTRKPAASLEHFSQRFTPIWEQTMTPDQCLAFFQDTGKCLLKPLC